MKTDTKGRIALIIAVLVPVAVIAAIAIAIYLPGRMANTSYDFVYQMSSGDRVIVQNGKITSIVNRPDYAPKYIDTETGQQVKPVTPSLYTYHVADDTSSELTLADAKLLNISENPVSPDGFSIVDGRGGGGIFPFFYDGGNYGDKYLKSGLSTKKLNVLGYQSTPYDYRSFVFIGWILK